MGGKDVSVYQRKSCCGLLLFAKGGGSYDWHQAVWVLLERIMKALALVITRQILQLHLQKVLALAVAAPQLVTVYGCVWGDGVGRSVSL